MDDEQMAEILEEPFHSLVTVFADTVLFSIPILNDGNSPIFNDDNDPVYMG